MGLYRDSGKMEATGIIGGCTPYMLLNLHPQLGQIGSFHIRGFSSHSIQT